MTLFHFSVRTVLQRKIVVFLQDLRKFLSTAIDSSRTRYTVSVGSVTITTHSSTDGAATLSRMNFSGYVGHVTLFS